MFCSQQHIGFTPFLSPLSSYPRPSTLPNPNPSYLITISSTYTLLLSQLPPPSPRPPPTRLIIDMCRPLQPLRPPLLRISNLVYDGLRGVRRRDPVAQLRVILAGLHRPNVLALVEANVLEDVKQRVAGRSPKTRRFVDLKVVEEIQVARRVVGLRRECS